MKILVVDDDPLTLDAVGACIEADGFQVIRAENGLEALKLWRQCSPDLICLDIMMPECNGYEVCKQIRMADDKVAILFLSAKNEEDDLIVGLKLGADDFIRKPFTRGELMARIHAALRRIPARNEEGQFTMRDLLVRSRQLVAERGDTRIELTPREVSILKLLYANADEPVSRDQFLDECWGIDYFPDSRTLDQHIFVLRKKIECTLTQRDIIDTVRGVGYRYSS